MAVLSLPLTFTNSFWSQDYRRGLEVLYAKLEQGVAESDEIVTFIRARAIAENNIASSLSNPSLTGRPGTGFSADEGASLLMAFRGLQAESIAQGQVHNNIAKELNTLVADPFEQWAESYKERLIQNKATVVDNWLRSYELAQGDIAKLKQQYLTKVRKADEAEDDAKFAPNSGGTADKFTSSPRLRPVDGHRTAPQRTASVSERIAQRLKEIQKKSADALAQATSTEDPNASPESIDEKPLPKVDKGKGREIVEEPEDLASPPPMSPMPPPKELPGSNQSQMPQLILLAGLSMSPAAVSQLLTRAAAELPLRPVRFPLLGEYQDAFTGDEFVAWLRENVQGLGGSLDRAEEAAKDLTQREGLLRRLGELGNLFEDSEDAFFQFRPKAFELDKFSSETPSSPKARPETLLKKTGTFVSLVSKALNNSSANAEPAFIRARNDADDADKAYRIGVRRLDRHRLALEERIEETLKLLQRWESERLRAVKTVLLQYQGTLSNLPKSMEPPIERSATLIASYQPESDLTALIERYRTGPFRPDPQIYESVAHDESDVVFGIDLRKWAEGGWYALTQGDEKKELIPPVLTALLNGLDAAYERVPNDIEKRKAWIYDVPLPAVHHLRESLNAIPPDQAYSTDLLSKFDAPVIASSIKLWMLELDPPLALYEGWEDFRKIYPNVGSAQKAGEESEEQRLQTVSSALQRFPRVHLYVLDAVVKHLKNLVETTKVDEANEVYFTKIALSLGRTVLRPKVETELSIQDRHPTLLFLDLLNHYDALLPPTIARKKRESERKVPVRKRTAPIDMRLSRSRISLGADAQQLLAAQQIAQNPSLAHKSPELPALPPPAVGAPQVAPMASAPLPPPPPPPVQAKTPPPPPPPVLEQVKAPPPPPPVREQVKAPPPPPPILEQVKAPPPPPVLPTPPPPPPTASQNGAAGRPSFKEPPPEFDNVPPRPSFREPPPEVDGIPSRPRFADPPPEDSDVPAPPGVAASPPETKVIPPTPQKRGTGSGEASPRKVASRSPSPPPTNDDVVLGSGKTSISRSGSGQSTVIRGPRLARGPRGTSSGSVQNLVQNLNRNSIGSQPTATPTSPKVNRLSGSGSPVRRPSSVVGRSAAAFSRRTMASDAEDDVVDKK
ncbi:hypothetical protein GALMADRAFT_260135 [Galerina marginata CBS 339.88]|uniref:Rho-GAP domain-containing protein n=1 Tax=Galerina marginata (strain CBS 339.88) TaxID=685588 RepID=A0A067S4J3_GALM3|nr:hypothetical protein GALMADRAFT_260135 [Galerina marginata CBS 339.88]